MEADEVIQAKQNLLQSEIIDKNYDKTAFINFCLSKKENGDDLNNWTLEELTEIVTEFVKNQNEAQQEAQPEEQKAYASNDQPPTEGENPEIKKEDIEKMEKFNAEDSKNFIPFLFAYSSASFVDTFLSFIGKSHLFPTKTTIIFSFSFSLT